jgi:hypothetical protein
MQFAKLVISLYSIEILYDIQLIKISTKECFIKLDKKECENWPMQLALWKKGE